MRFESREERTFWTIAVLRLVPDAVIGAIVASASDSGALGFLATVVALQILYLLIWIKNSAWGWFLYWAKGRKDLTANFLTFLTDNRFPEPGSYQTSVQGYLDSVVSNESEPIETRLKAAAQIGAMGVRPLVGGFQYSMKLGMAYEDGLEQFKALFNRPTKQRPPPLR
jgi:hypothetical protein